jgi:hypothetical protein
MSFQEFFNANLGFPTLRIFLLIFYIFKCAPSPHFESQVYGYMHMLGGSSKAVVA